MTVLSKGWLRDPVSRPALSRLARVRLLESVLVLAARRPWAPTGASLWAPSQAGFTPKMRAQDLQLALAMVHTLRAITQALRALQDTSLFRDPSDRCLLAPALALVLVP